MRRTMSTPSSSYSPTTASVAAVRRGAVGRRRSVLAAAAASSRTDPKQRIVITGQGIVSAFGNDVDVFYDKYVRVAHSRCAAHPRRPSHFPCRSTTRKTRASPFRVGCAREGFPSVVSSSSSTLFPPLSLCLCLSVATDAHCDHNVSIIAFIEMIQRVSNRLGY